ncbi:hypothetical protein ACFV2Q_31210 [Streptomyces sp. NPDC059650]|uniref:hypothetical protein n=1 Tax=Streptomyces sp. NPDC059650 TaxID=3346896 RepID=UPI0036C51D9D
MYFRRLTVACAALASLALSAAPAAPAQQAVATDISRTSPYGQLSATAYWQSRGSLTIPASSLGDTCGDGHRSYWQIVWNPGTSSEGAGGKRYADECRTTAWTDPTRVSAAYVRSIDVWVCHHRWWGTDACDRATYHNPYYTP